MYVKLDRAVVSLRFICFDQRFMCAPSIGFVLFCLHRFVRFVHSTIFFVSKIIYFFEIVYGTSCCFRFALSGVRVLVFLVLNK